MRKPAIERLLITGAAGKTGLAILTKISEIAPSRFRCRALARDSSQRPALEGAGADEVVVGDLTDREDLERALGEADVVYHICPNVHPEEVAIGSRMIELAQRAGVRRFIFHSVLEPRIREMPHHWAKAQVEQLLAESQLEFTIVQPAPYMQNILGQRKSLVETGVYRVPYALATRVSLVDLDDVAEAAARILTSPGHSGATYELCAPGLLDQIEIAEELGRALGRPVRAEKLDRETWARAAGAAGMASHQVDTLLAMFRYYERSGMAGSHRPLESLLGRAPNRFVDFTQRAFGEPPVS